MGASTIILDWRHDREGGSEKTPLEFFVSAPRGGPLEG
jgi:hypothetical protein